MEDTADCIFGPFLVRKQDGSTFKNHAVKAVTKKLAETGVCTNGSKVYENHELEVRLLKMVCRFFFSLSSLQTLTRHE